jgi:hypothetical protein
VLLQQYIVVCWLLSGRFIRKKKGFLCGKYLVDEENSPTICAIFIIFFAGEFAKQYDNYKEWGLANDKLPYFRANM